MKALSIHPYYAILIFNKEKKEEYRNWQTDYRGPLLICASQYNDGPDMPRGVAIGTVDLVDIVPAKNGESKFAWILKNPRYIKPVPVKGRLHLYDVDVPLQYSRPNTTAAAYKIYVAEGLVKEAY